MTSAAYPHEDPDHDQGSALARLDAAVVPVLQRRAHATAEVVGAPLRVIGRWEARVAHGRAYPYLRARARFLMLGAVLLAFIGSSVHFQRFPDLREQRLAAEASAQGQSVRPGGSSAAGTGGLAGGGQIIGPVIGDRALRYIEERAAALVTVPDGETRVAVLSFVDYRSGADAAASVPAGLDVLEAHVRVPASEERPFVTEVTSGDIVGSVSRALAAPREALVEEIAGLRELLDGGTITDESFAIQMRIDLDRAVATRNLLDSGAGTVFALVVRGPAELLRVAAARAEVRLVDVAPGETDPRTSVFYGLLPEEQGQLSYGAAA